MKRYGVKYEQPINETHTRTTTIQLTEYLGIWKLSMRVLEQNKEAVDNLSPFELPTLDIQQIPYDKSIEMPEAMAYVLLKSGEFQELEARQMWMGASVMEDGILPN